MIVLVLLCMVALCLICSLGAYATERMDRDNDYCVESDDVFDWMMKGIDL